MIKLIMLKNYFHKDMTYDENINNKSFIKVINKEKKSVVDINILLNRVKINEKKQIKRKIIFFSSITIGLILFGISITSIT